MKNLDKTKAYDLRYLNDKQLEYLLCWLRNNDKGWGGYNISVLKKYGLLGFKEDFNCWVLDYLNKEIETTKALELFEDMKEITEEQKQQLINLNDSKVNEILGVNTYNNWYKYKNTNFLMYIHDNGRYGFGADGLWLDNLNENESLNKIEGYNLATDEEVEKALINEAKRIGLTHENKFKDCNDVLFNKGYGYYVFENNKLYYNGATLFDNGKWAEVIEKPNKQEIINQINELLKQL